MSSLHFEWLPGQSAAPAFKARVQTEAVLRRILCIIEKKDSKPGKNQTFVRSKF